ncbi:hypothetical protein [Pedobacter sp. UYP1]|uniref:hypothetical protein n=1 Tax=Pedobacter sp. UYP1 TaxID=1756396 RepID=UPI0033955392
MNNKIKIIIALLLFVNFNLSAQTDSLVNGKYINKTIGWSMDVPAGWHIETSKDKAELFKRLEKTANHKLNGSAATQLMSFSKGDNTGPMFRSMIEDSVSLASKSVKNLDDFTRNILTVLKKTYPSTKMDTKVQTLTVGSQDFRSIIYTRDGYTGVNQTILAYRKGYLFTMTWYFDKVEDKTAIENAVLSSTFQ